jgi:PKHD-type hydroxylase
MLFAISEVLADNELEEITSVLESGEFLEGKRTAGPRAARVKNNLQFKKTDDNRERLNGLIIKALERSDVFNAAVLPQRIHRPLFARYEVGMEYGYHVDGALMDKPDALRTDVSVTVFLNEPDAYEGGELMIESPLGEQKIKLPARSAIIYPSSTLHRVAQVTRGVRLAAVTWVQSYVRDPAHREVLFDLHRIRNGLGSLHPDCLETDLAHKAYTNLMRMWAEP